MTMTNKEYIQKINRLKEIEAMVKNPDSSLEKIDELIEETRTLASACYAYTRELREKVDTLDEIGNEKSQPLK